MPTPTLEQLEPRRLASFSISGHVWSDHVGDGIFYHTDFPIARRVVYLDLNRNGAFDAASDKYVFTDSRGAYRIPLARYRNYYVRVVLGRDEIQTKPVHNGAYRLASGSNVDFWVEPPGNCAISGNIADDPDGDLSQTMDPKPLRNIRVTLKTSQSDAPGATVATATTDQRGNYWFKQLHPGKYFVLADLPKNRRLKFDRWPQVDLTFGQTYPYASPEFTATSIIRGRVIGPRYNYYTGDPLGEPGWTVYLDANRNGALDEGEHSVITGLGGTWSFELPDGGSYNVRLADRVGYTIVNPPGSLLNVRVGTASVVKDLKFQVK